MLKTESATPAPDVLAGMREFFAAGFFEEPDASPMRRWARAVRRGLEHRTPPTYHGGLLYPCGPAATGDENRVVWPCYSFTWGFSAAAVQERLDGASEPEREALQALAECMRDEARRVDGWDTVHTVGGRGFTHSIVNYGRVIREGLNEYGRRVEAGLAAARPGDDKADFYLGLQDVIAGIRSWHRGLCGALAAWAAEAPERGTARDRLLDALARVPFEPARTFYEAFVAYNLVWYLDGCDNPGRIDQELARFYERDVERGLVTREEALALFREFTANVSANHGWSAAIGGTTEDGGPGYNELTVLCLEAVHGHHRPNYELRVRDDMPDAVWDAALDALATGCGQPALYNEERYLASLLGLDLGLTPADAAWWNGGGCTETMIHGRSNVGSLDAGISLPLILEGTLETALPGAGTFDAVLQAFKHGVADVVREIVDNVSRDQEAKACYRPQPLRSLLIDDCIERGVEYNAGGARYNWSVINVAGLADVVDSLAAVREIVFESQEKSGPELLEILRRNFAGEESLRARLAACPRFGNDDSRADSLAADLADFTFREFLRYTPWRGGRFLPSCIMFTTYSGVGASIGASPDGRRAGEPVADSIGPHQGRDVHGPTAMLRSVTRLPLHLAAGTPVVNIRLTRDFFTTGERRRRLRDLLQTYFRMGGMQIQVSVVDQEVLRDAIAHPERHENLIVRIGGFSAYFNPLSAELKQTILERSEHGV
ncbi:MAG: hypothetical protein JXR94_14995 [Candidatus Hydrogenedentes bacterium]|nr:hypothetical protein [Candidatus Hydrogenedentota bacterium]